MTLGGAAQVAAAHCQNDQTLDPAVCSQTDPPMPQPVALWPSPRNVLWQRLAIFCNEYYQILIAVLVGLEPATFESLVRDLTTTPPSHTLGHLAIHGDMWGQLRGQGRGYRRVAPHLAPH